MNAPAHDVALLLVALGVAPALGSQTAWSVYVGREPAAPDSVLTVYDTGATRTADEDNGTYWPSVQIRARSHDYRGAWGKLEAARDALLAVRNRTESGTEYVGFWAPNGVTGIGFDDSDRAILVQNINILRV